MGKTGGFKEYDRKTSPKRPIEERIHDHKELYIALENEELKKQAARCMDCGVPFCSSQCPLGNNIPDFNDLVYNDEWKKALETLHMTNNFPEFTGRVCPAPCEAGCVLGINRKPTNIRELELSIIERGFAEGWVVPQSPVVRTGKKVAVVGSGPSGLAAAQQLNRAGHKVTVFERSEEIGGILSLGIPDYKIEKWVMQRRLEQLIQEGIEFKTGMNVGVDIPAELLQKEFDVICLTGGSTIPRDLPVSGRELNGIHFAMDFLTQQNRINKGEVISDAERITAKDKNVIIIGGGDTGADCLGISIRQGAKQIYQIELLPKPPEARTEAMPWPYWPMILRTNTSHEEGGTREWSIATKYFSGEHGKVKKIHCVRLEWSEPDENGRRTMKEVPDSEFVLDADLVLLAMGFVHPQQNGLLEDLGVEFDNRGNVKTDKNFMTSVSGVFSAGDMHKGQSLICHAIAEGRKAAANIDKYLMKNN